MSFGAENFPDLIMTISDGAEKTNKQQVSIKYTSQRTDITEVSLTDGSTCSGDNWTRASKNLLKNLSSGDGEKKISMQVKTQYGFKSQCVTKSIILDTTGPVILSVSGPQDKNYANGESIEFEVTLSEAGSVVGTPSLVFNFGTDTRKAIYVSGGGSSNF